MLQKERLDEQCRVLTGDEALAQQVLHPVDVDADAVQRLLRDHRVSELLSLLAAFLDELLYEDWRECDEDAV